MFSDPVKNIEQCDIKPGMEVADFGAGSGHYVLAIAKKLSSTGHVFAVDIQKELLDRIKNEAQRNGLYNVEVIWGDLEKSKGSNLNNNSIDFLVLSNILFQLQNKNIPLDEAKRVLKPDGRVLVIDWQDSFNGLGPKPEMVFNRDMAMDLFESNGFKLDREIVAGAHHYGLVFKN